MLCTFLCNSKSKAIAEGDERETTEQKSFVNSVNASSADCHHDEKAVDLYTAATRNPHHEKYFAAIPGQQGLIGVPLEAIAAMRNDKEKSLSPNHQQSNVSQSPISHRSEDGSATPSQNDLNVNDIHHYQQHHSRAPSSFDPINEQHQHQDKSSQALKGRFVVSEENDDDNNNHDYETDQQQQSISNQPIQSNLSFVQHSDSRYRDAKSINDIQNQKYYQNGEADNQTPEKIGRFAISDE